MNNTAPKFRPFRLAADNDNDSFIDSDVGYPNRRAQYRGYRVLIGLIFLGGLVAMVGGLLQGAGKIAAAFPTMEALTEGAAWMTFLSGLGQLATVGLLAVILALFLRWRIRRRRRHA